MTLRELDPELFQGASLDGPAIGDELAQAAWAIDVRGWAVGEAVPVAAVELWHGRELLRRAEPSISRPDVVEGFPRAADPCGFYVPVSALSLPLEFELSVRAVLADGRSAELALVRGRRQPLRSSFEPYFQPLMVTTIGRTGSTMLVHLLGSHPAVVAYQPFLSEPRVLSYWIGVLRSLSDPASYRRQLQQAADLGDPAWWLGAAEPWPRRVQNAELHEWLGADAVSELAAWSQSRVDAIYDRIAALTGGGGAAYFAEKCQPAVAPPLVWELYSGCREVFLVRDPRDMLCSMLAYNAKRGVQGFGRGRVGTDAEFAAAIAAAAAELARAWESRRDRAHLVRYEDLVLEPAETLRGTLEYLDVESGDEMIDAMLGSLAAAESEGHRTTASAAESVGRWRAELDGELERGFAQELAPALEAFGYG